MSDIHDAGCACCGDGHIEIVLTVADQRRLVESRAGEPCFRMWVKREEFLGKPDWSCYPLDVDGNTWAMWRRKSDLDNLRNMRGDMADHLVTLIESRMLLDDDNTNELPSKS